ncbi:MAG: DUF488 family protein [Alphaproteobacteria bacterium]|nr:DUF488 family protein [Alphaproteobacteria bacterium]
MQAENFFTKELLDGAYLLCMEEKPSQCHRQLLAEYLSKKFNIEKIKHL